MGSHRLQQLSFLRHFKGTLITTYTGLWEVSDLLKMVAKAQLQRPREVETHNSVSMVFIWQKSVLLF